MSPQNMFRHFPPALSKALLETNKNGKNIVSQFEIMCLNISNLFASY